MNRSIGEDRAAPCALKPAVEFVYCVSLCGSRRSAVTAAEAVASATAAHQQQQQQPRPRPRRRTNYCYTGRPYVTGLTGTSPPGDILTAVTADTRDTDSLCEAELWDGGGRLSERPLEELRLMGHTRCRLARFDPSVLLTVGDPIHGGSLQRRLSTIKLT